MKEIAVMGHEAPPADNAGYPLESLILTFETTNDDKDGDTVVSISIDNRTTAMGGGSVGGGQHWDDWSSHAAAVRVSNRIDFYQAGQGHMNVTIHPNGDDEWHFNVRLDMGFAGGFKRWVTWSGINLAEDRPSIDLTWG